MSWRSCMMDEFIVLEMKATLIPGDELKLLYMALGRLHGLALGRALQCMEVQLLALRAVDAGCEVESMDEVVTFVQAMRFLAC